MLGWTTELCDISYSLLQVAINVLNTFVLSKLHHFESDVKRRKTLQWPRSVSCINIRYNVCEFPHMINVCESPPPPSNGVEYPHPINARWRHEMETFSVLLTLCAENSPATGEFAPHRPVTLNFDVFFDLRLNKRLSKKSWGWWFETPSYPLWRHCNGFMKLQQARHILVWLLSSEKTNCIKFQDPDLKHDFMNANMS